MVLELVVRLLEQVVWPIVAVVAVILLRTPLSSLIQSVQELRYKEFTALFRETAQTTEDAVRGESGVTDVPDPDIGEDPRLAVLLAWERLQRAASSKLDELSPGQSANSDPERALGYFEYLDVFELPIQRAISQLRDLRSQATHTPSRTISIDAAKAYTRTAKMIQNRIAGLSFLPRMKLNRLTLLILGLNVLLDSGKYFDISIEDVRSQISQGTVLQYLKSVAGSGIDLSLHLGEHDTIGFEQEYSRQLRALYNHYGGSESRKWGVENSGICLLIAWTNEIIQQGSGWLHMEVGGD